MLFLRLALFLLLTAGLAYLAICAYLWANQERLLFFPARATDAELEALARERGLLPWTNARGERIGWKSPRHPDAPALLICHGNGGFALGRDFSALSETPPTFQLHLLEYPGYGARPGPPGANALVAAEVDAIDTLSAENPTRPLILLGQSLGSGVASAAAAARPAQVTAVVLLTPFDSLAHAAGHHYPWLPVRLLLRHHLDSDRNLARYPGPVAFLLGGRDGTTPPALGQKLFAGHTGPKRLWLAPEAGHNDFDLLLAPWPEVATWLPSHEN